MQQEYLIPIVLILKALTGSRCSVYSRYWYKLALLVQKYKD